MNYYAKLLEEKKNFKEEKENASVEDKFSYKGCLITILKKSEGKYTFSITQKGREEGTNNVYSTQEEAERKAKREVEEVWANSKEEKRYYAELIEKRNDAGLSRAINIALTFLKEGADDDRIKKEMERDYKISPEITKDALIAAKKLLRK